MKIMNLYQFKDSISKKMPVVREKSLFSSLNELMTIDFINTEIITEYTIDVAEDFNFKYYSNEELVKLCETSQSVIDHHFVTTLNHYDVI